MSRLDHLLTMGALRDPSRLFLCGPEEWTYARADAEVSERAARFRRQSSGLPVSVRGVNSANWVLNVLALLRAHIPAILIPQELIQPEVAALLQVAGTRFQVEDERWESTGIEPSGLPEWLGEDVAVGFATSGSTGEPRVALRTHSSLTDEGARYQAMWQARPEDVFFSPSPLYHAYSFGAALAAALTSGSTLLPAVFRSPHIVSSQIRASGATILTIVPVMARALSLADQGQPVQSNLRIVMVGAGQITDEISTLFSLRWGVGLSRNYGSSETGAILACLNTSAGDITGEPMPGIHCQLVDSPGLAGSQLWVQLKHAPCGYLIPGGYEAALLSPGGWWPMGDLFESNNSHGLRLIGRRGSAIRRGGHSIQPREIEAALLASPAVSEVCVKGALDRNGEECVEVHVALKEPGGASADDLHQFLKTRLAPYKIPNRWHFYDSLPKTWSNKVSVRHLAAGEAPQPPSPVQAAQGFRLSHALFAAHQLGLLPELEGQAQSIESLAEKLSCDPNALGLLLEYLRDRGVVNRSSTGFRLAHKLPRGWKAIYKLEEHLRQTWLSPEKIMTVVRNGLDRRDFEQEAEPAAFSEIYMDALCGPWQDMAALTLQRKLRLPLKGRVLEVGRAAGRITLHLRKALQMAARFCALAPAPALGWNELQEDERRTTWTWERLPLEPGSLDALVLTNVIHWLPPRNAPEVLQNLTAALRPGGMLVVLDIFVDTTPEASQFLLDWLTHGGVHWARLRDLKDLFIQAGFSNVQAESVGGVSVQLITCRRPAQTTQLHNLTLAEKKQ